MRFFPSRRPGPAHLEGLTHHSDPTHAILRLQRVTLVLIILNSLALGAVLTIWAFALWGYPVPEMPLHP